MGRDVYLQDDASGMDPPNPKIGHIKSKDERKRCREQDGSLVMITSYKQHKAFIC